MLVVRDGLLNWPTTNFTVKYKCGLSNVEADALSRISWPEILAETEDLDVDLKCMDTHVVNAIFDWLQIKV